jgi:trans-aconitate methyltransferase
MAKLTAGVRVADVGCGLSASAVLLAQSFPAAHCLASTAWLALPG